MKLIKYKDVESRFKEYSNKRPNLLGVKRGGILSKNIQLVNKCSWVFILPKDIFPEYFCCFRADFINDIISMSDKSDVVPFSAEIFAKRILDVKEKNKEMLDKKKNQSRKKSDYFAKKTEYDSVKMNFFHEHKDCIKSKSDWAWSAKYNLTHNETESEKRFQIFLNKINGQSFFETQRYFDLDGHIFFADFYSRKLKLIVEIDGGYHNTPEQIKKKEKRNKIFNIHGITVYRVKNEDLLNFNKMVTVYSFINKRGKSMKKHWHLKFFSKQEFESFYL